MPIIAAVIIGTLIGLLLVQTGFLTARRLFATGLGALGAVCAIFLVRFAAGSVGIVGAVIAATIGAVLILFLARFIDRPGGD